MMPDGPRLSQHTRALCALLVLTSGAGLAWSSAQPGAEVRPPASPLPATAPPATTGSETEVVFKDGARVSGMVVEQSPETIVMSINGIRTTFKMSTIDRIRVLPPIEDRYRALRDTIDPEDADGIMKLAEWLRARGRLDLALTEIDRVLELEPANPSARDLRTLIVEQEKLSAATSAPRSDRKPIAPLSKTPRAAEFPLLTEEQVNLIRVFEVDLNDPPRMIITRDTMRRFLDKYAGTVVEGRGSVPVTPEGRDLFYRLKPAEVLGWMFDLKAREFYNEVEVMENPASMRRFRDDIHRTWLTNSCATSRCHGGEDAGRLWLYNRRNGSDAAAYTNFLILERFRLENGLPLINYNEPSRSVLLQMGLSRDSAVFKHPEVVGLHRGKWKAVFRSEDDHKYQQAVDWILSMYPKRTDYPVEYTPPVPSTLRTQTPADGEGGDPGRR